MDEDKLKTLKGKVNRIKSQLDVKRGERAAVQKNLEKEFGIKKGDDPYELLKDLGAQIEEKEEKRTILIKKVEGILEGYA